MDGDEVQAMFLSYLIDVVLLYVEADQAFDSRHPVLKSYVWLIEHRQDWR